MKLAVVCLIVFLGPMLHATDNMSGVLNLSRWSKPRSFFNNQETYSSTFWFSGKKYISKKTDVFLDGYVSAESNRKKSLSSGEFREGYLNYSGEDVDLRVGRQIINWGRADGINPTDNITPQNFGLLTSDDSKQKSGVTSTSLSVYKSDFRIHLLWLPEFRAHKIPMPLENYNETYPKKLLEQFAFKLEKTAGDIDWSFSYFDGFDRYPSLGVKDISYNRIKVIGFDGATAVESFGLRIESAYTFTQDESGTNPLEKNPLLFSVFGVDRHFFEKLYVNVQYLNRTTIGFRDYKQNQNPILQTLEKEQSIFANQYERVLHGLTARISRKWYDNNLETELSFLGWLNHGDYLLKPKLTYIFSDSLKGALGADLYRGSKNTFLGRLKELSTTYCELSMYF